LEPPLKFKNEAEKLLLHALAIRGGRVDNPLFRRSNLAAQ
jgi:hypothetical protein